jgi:hypothetical protein
VGKVSADHPNVGALVRDQATDRVGVCMGKAGPFAMLRPVGGGTEWETRPESLRAVREVSRA